MSKATAALTVGIGAVGVSPSQVANLFFDAEQVTQITNAIKNDGIEQADAGMAPPQELNKFVGDVVDQFGRRSNQQVSVALPIPSARAVFFVHRVIELFPLRIGCDTLHNHLFAIPLSSTMIVALVYGNLEVSNAQAIALALVTVISLILLVVALANTAKK